MVSLQSACDSSHDLIYSFSKYNCRVENFAQTVFFFFFYFFPLNGFFNVVVVSAFFVLFFVCLFFLKKASAIA